MRIVLGCLLIGVAATYPLPLNAQAGVDLLKIVARAKPGAAHAALQPLVGTWRVEKRVFNALGTPDKPARSAGMVTRRDWTPGGHFLRDVTRGTINGTQYERTGYLGYNPIARRYEWNTVDNVTPIMMTYHGATDSGGAQPIVMTGTFADIGVTGENNVGKSVAMRTRITLIDADHHRFEIYFTPPHGAEQLADRMDFERVK